MTNVSAVRADIEKAVAILAGGGIVAFPTDTLYALGAAASEAQAVRRVFEIKGREAGKALPLFISGIAAADEIAAVGPLAKKLAARFWPGALTLVVVKRDSFDSEALAGGSTVALRVPANPIALEILRALGEPVTATSANLSGGPDPVAADEVRRQLGGRVDMILDAGPCDAGIPSTIVDCTGEAPRVLRRGAISEAEIEAAVAPEP
jgi:L-threonylcarbamoyladenylate synthase